MRTVLKKVYYCDFCGKHSLRPVTKHEKYCTGNPDRGCRMCEDPVNIREIAPNVVLNPGVADGPPIIPMEVLLGITDCPACTLALIRGIRRIHPDGQSLYEEPGFNYKTAVEQWWQGHRPDEPELSPGDY